MEKIKRAKMPKKKKIILIVSCILLALSVLSLAYYFGMGGFLYSLALERNSTLFLQAAKQKAGDTSPIKQEKEWWNAQAKTERAVTSFDGLTLAGYEMCQPAPTHRWALVLHGYRGNAIHMSAFSKTYFEHGFNVLTPDLRAHGNSQGSTISMGWFDRLDTLAWINSIVLRDPQAQIVLHGVSMGAATVMMTTGEAALPANVKVAVEDCGYTSVYQQFAYLLDSVIGVPRALCLPEMQTMVQLKSGYDIKNASATAQLAKSKTPTVFVHGELDSFVPHFMLQQNYDAAQIAPKKLLSVPNAVHGASAFVAPELYWNTIFTFAEPYLS